MYCQYVLGIGHLVRTLVIADELSKSHDLLLLCGGKPIDTSIAPRVKIVWIEPMEALQDFSHYYSPTDASIEYPQVCQKRLNQILVSIDDFQPDIFWIEAFPFARHRFKREIIPSIKHVQKKIPHCKICCSYRDVFLGRHGDTAKHKKISYWLNKYFDYLFIHSDPKIISLHSTFASVDEIKCPIFYTGFVVRPLPKQIEKVNGSDMQEIVVSHGGSRVGKKIADIAVQCHDQFFPKTSLHVFSNPNSTTVTPKHPSKKIHLHPFDWDYIRHLQRATVFIGMGGYNSLIEAVALGIPAFVIPFNGNEEQTTRVELLKKHHPIEVAPWDQLTEKRMADAIRKLIAQRAGPTQINFDGAKVVGEILKGL